MISTWQLKSWNSMHIHSNSVLHYLDNMVVGLVIYSEARAFEAKSSRPRNLTLWPRINIADWD